MALDEGGEKAARRMAEFGGRLKLFPDNKDVSKELKNVLYGFTTDETLEDVVARALELLAEKPAAPSASQPGSGARSADRRPSGKRPSENSVPLDRLSQPYRFIDLPDRVAMPEPGVAGAALNDPLPDGFSARILVDWIAESPLLIGGAAEGKGQDGGAVEPLSIGGRHVLPGATLRGLTRAVTEIVSYAKMTQGNWHYRFGLRDFVHPYYATESGVSKVKEVKGGFLRIRPAQSGDDAGKVVELGGESLVYELSCGLDWGHVRIPSLAALGVPGHLLAPQQNNRGHTGYPRWTAAPVFDDSKVDGKYTLLKMGRGNAIDFSRQHAFRLVEKTYDKAVYDADPSGSMQGVMVVAGKLPGSGNKIYEYFVTPDPKAPVRAIDKDIAILFERMHSRPGKGDRLEAEGNWATLRKLAMKDPGIPVFHVGDPAAPTQGSGFFFGLTRLFKIPHKRSVGEVLYGRQPAHRPKFSDHYENVDFAEALFGYVIEPRDWLMEDADLSRAPDSVARKGRVAFSFAPLSTRTPARISTPVEVIQMAPRASFAPFYLRGTEKDFSAADARIAGRKAYFPQFSKPDYPGALKRFAAFGEKQKQDVRDSSQGKNPSPDTLSRLKFLVPEKDRPLEFTGEIRLHNVTAAEIGAILFAITHGGDAQKRFRHMIGRGKPFGAGQMRIGRVVVKAEANGPLGEPLLRPSTPEEMFDPVTGHGFAEGGGLSLQPFLEAFETHMRGQVGAAWPLQSAAICEWLGMSDPAPGTALAEAGRLVYKAYEADPATEKPVKPFGAYRALREATQQMHSTDKPRGGDRLLPAPRADPPRR
ncbi:CRISPR-associated protein (TIGR03986 family) [Hoeflea marina]|uniref:CRISPR-associated protein (TIGR03986 family) n=1 Tax=Hoeflea marina TaxID=274592 RepID=A0A317PWG4_9HYPH|nr:TIGR03986 family CRISPR-associated RAMP protein [Hoeflea marina]PWW03810.1 CRISPR-associated protein (TIGR03986 family) [Hoeflea marina]